MTEPTKRRHVYPVGPIATLTVRDKTGFGTVRILLNDGLTDSGSDDKVPEFNYRDEFIRYQIQDGMPCHLKGLF